MAVACTTSIKGKAKNGKRLCRQGNRRREVKQTKKKEKSFDMGQSSSPAWVTKANVGLGKVPECQTDCSMYCAQETSPRNPDTNDLEADSK